MSGEQSKNPEFFDQDSVMIYIDPKVMSSLSDMAEKKQEDLKALQVAAEEGDLDAQYRLGRSYYYGDDGAPKDGEKAFEWFSRAAEGDSIAAQYYLGLCYSRAVGVEKDLVRAAELFTAVAYPLYAHGRSTRPFVVTDECISCGLCQEICPCGAITLSGGKPAWTKSKCVQCLGCLHRCPTQAIHWKKADEHRGRYYNPRVEP